MFSRTDDDDDVDAVFDVHVAAHLNVLVLRGPVDLPAEAECIKWKETSITALDDLEARDVDGDLLGAGAPRERLGLFGQYGLTFILSVPAGSF